MTRIIVEQKPPPKSLHNTEVQLMAEYFF